MDHRRHEPVVLKQFAVCFNSFALFVDGTINKKMYLRQATRPNGVPHWSLFFIPNQGRSQPIDLWARPYKL